MLCNIQRYCFNWSDLQCTILLKKNRQCTCFKHRNYFNYVVNCKNACSKKINLIKSYYIIFFFVSYNYLKNIYIYVIYSVDIKIQSYILH